MSNKVVHEVEISNRLLRAIQDTGTEQQAEVDIIGDTAAAKDRATCSITINSKTIVEFVLVMDVDMDGLSSMAALAGLN